MAGAGFRLAGSGIALPGRRLASADIDVRIGRPCGWLERRTGVAERYVCEAELQDDLADTAGRAALAEAAVAPTSIDCVLFAGAVPKHLIPATAPLVARRLGLTGGRVTTLDVNSTCLSFLSALDLALMHLAAGRFRCILVVAAEIPSRALPWDSDPVTAGLFGDGAAAVVLTAGDGAGASRVAAARFETYPEGYDLCQLEAGGTAIDLRAEEERFMAAAFFRMNGPELYKLSARHFPGFVDRLLADAGWDREAVDLVVPHQASHLALEHLVQRCHFPRSKVIDIVAGYGNQVAASLPTALHLARLAGRMAKGMRVLLLGTSAGVSFGGMAIEV